MSALNDYIRKLEKNLIGVEEEKKRAIVRDLDTQILKMAEEYGGGEEGLKRALSEIESPEVMGKKYARLYGLGYRDFLLISGIALLLSTFSLAVIPFTTAQNMFSLLILPLLALFIVFVGINWGMKAAFIPALLSAIWRSALFQITLYLHPFEINAGGSGVYIVHLTSIVLVIMVLAFPMAGRE